MDFLPHIFCVLYDFHIMKKEPQPRKGIGFMNLLFLVVVVWLGYGAIKEMSNKYLTSLKL